MSNAFWYSLLIVISIIVFIYTLIKVHDKKVIVLYTFLSGLTYSFEYVVLVLLNSYVYLPNILKDPYFDSLLGAVVSDAFNVPIIGTLIGALRLYWKWMIVFTGIFLLIEKFFLFVDAYRHIWWNISFTGIGLIIQFWIAKKWYTLLKENLTTRVRFFSLFFTCLLMQASAIFVLVAFFGRYYYTLGWFDNETRDHVAFATTYAFFISLIITSLVVFNIKWFWRIITILLTVPINWLLLHYDILHLSSKWSLVHFFLLRLLFLILLDRFQYFFIYPKRM